MPLVLAASGNRKTRDSIRTAVERLGYKLTIVQTGAAALQILQTKQVDALITDELLPDWDAYALFRRTPVNSTGRKPPGLMLMPPRNNISFLDLDLENDWSQLFGNAS